MSAAKSPITTLSSASEDDTARIAAMLARRCMPGDCILLHGDLGAGKTAFARGFIQAVAPGCGDIVSPTFTLVQTYPAGSGVLIYHFDLYRLESVREVEEIGLEEALQSGITLVEWPELARHLLPKTALEITIGMGTSPDARQLAFAGPAAIWEERLKER